MKIGAAGGRWIAGSKHRTSARVHYPVAPPGRIRTSGTLRRFGRFAARVAIACRRLDRCRFLMWVASPQVNAAALPYAARVPQFPCWGGCEDLTSWAAQSPSESGTRFEQTGVSPQQESAPSSGSSVIDTDPLARTVGATGSFTNVDDAQCRVKLGQESLAFAAHHEFPEFLRALGSLVIRSC